MQGRFDNVQYDAASTLMHAGIKAKFEELEAMIEALPGSRPTSLALTSLEESYMWVGKAIRDDQILTRQRQSTKPAGENPCP